MGCSLWGHTELDMTEQLSTAQTVAARLLRPWDPPGKNSGARSHSLLQGIFLTLAPDSGGAYQRNDFSECRRLYLPIYRKALNSLAWDIQFSLIKIFFDV